MPFCDPQTSLRSNVNVFICNVRVFVFSLIVKTCKLYQENGNTHARILWTLGVFDVYCWKNVKNHIIFSLKNKFEREKKTSWHSKDECLLPIITTWSVSVLHTVCKFDAFYYDLWLMKCPNAHFCLFICLSVCVHCVALSSKSKLIKNKIENFCDFIRIRGSIWPLI